MFLGRYQIGERAAGSFGHVFAVIDAETLEARALKVATSATDTLLLDELAVLARLHHPSLPRVFEVGRTSEPIAGVPAGAPFFVAEWIAGGRCDAKPWDDPRALWSLIADVAGALAVIHAAGLVHGDVAPQNILLSGERAILVDLGLATASGARGTPAYMAPEAFAGRVDPRSDLYSLGATVARLVLGRPPFEATTLGELVHAIATQPQPQLHLPAPLADLVARLYARDPSARPASALAVLDELDQLAPVIAPGLPRRARPTVGAPPAAASWPGARPLADAIVHGLRGNRVQLVIGEPASGARELVDAALLAWQLGRTSRKERSPAIAAGSLDAIAARVGAGDGRGWLDRCARAVRGEAPDARLCVLELADDPRAADAIAALVRAGGGPVVVLVDRAPFETATVDRHSALPFGSAARSGEAGPIDRHEVGPLDHAGLAALATEMLGRESPAAWIAGLAAASSGFALAAIELVRSIAGEPDPLAVDWAARSTAGAAELRARALANVSPGARRIAIAIAAWGGRARGDRALATARAGDHAVGLAELVELERAGLVRRRGDELQLDRATIDAITSTAAGDVAACALAALADAGDIDLDARAALLCHAPLDAGLAQDACAIAEQLLARGRADRANELAQRAAWLVPARARLIEARAAAASGNYHDALELARAAEAAGADAIEARLVAARAAQRAGDLDAAEAELAQLYARAPSHDEVAGAYARLLVTRSRYADARRVATASTSSPASLAGLGGLRAEAAGLAAFYLGELDDADRAFAMLEVSAAAAGDPSAAGRAMSLRGMVAQQRGQLGLASDRYREAARQLHDAGEIHAAAVAELNLGTVLVERGRASEALPLLAAASRVFAELAATTEQIAADLNRGNALVAVGQPADARAAAEAALANANAGGAPHLRAFALLVLADAQRRLGDAGAEASDRGALAIALERDDAHAQLSAYVGLAEGGHAPPAGVDVDGLCASDDDRDRWIVARGRLALCAGDPRAGGASSTTWAAHVEACRGVGARAGDGDRLERAFRAYAVASQLADRAGDDVTAKREADRARTAHAAMLAAAAPAFRATLERDPDLAALVPADAAASAPDRTTGEPQLRRLLALSRRLNSEPDVTRILDEVIDTAIEVTAAERGFLLLRQPDGELAPVVSRNFAAADLHGSERSVSRSIAERAAQTGEPVMTVDAGIDERFAIAASVAALRLRSVLAVPLRQRGAITGCIYVDHRLRGGAFDDAAATVLGELADIAAIAIENARLTDHLRHAAREVDELNARLAADLAERDAELVRVKADLPDRARLRHAYEQIIGRSPAMVRMLDLVDRAAATALPVVIVGESGTGKELVARALHENGPRRAGAFVAINCSAVPEPLLESELFGHVRGAFTGADRDRRGLFEVADGGTLLLDEIADTSAAMQAKLLRVLQDGSIRRVGDTRTRTVDVRVIAASQRSLAELVTRGSFREDLRFRIEVISITVPPLRERDGDVPLLVEALLARIAAGRTPPRLTRAALRALGQHRWPGNVRELENALARGLAMCGDAVTSAIDIGDLPEVVAAAAARPEPAKPIAGDELKLKPALAATEQAYIAAAMERAKNNQTVAARLLGLSRFGLQKKLRRLAGDGEDADDADDK
ncbi:MAG TPA: sigma 54-interacting transcriptional regulator [Kofleriaceae bacterium]